MVTAWEVDLCFSCKSHFGSFDVSARVCSGCVVPCPHLTWRQHWSFWSVSGLFSPSFFFFFFFDKDKCFSSEWPCWHSIWCRGKQCLCTPRSPAVKEEFQSVWAKRSCSWESLPSGWALTVFADGFDLCWGGMCAGMSCRESWSDRPQCGRCTALYACTLCLSRHGQVCYSLWQSTSHTEWRWRIKIPSNDKKKTLSRWACCWALLTLASGGTWTAITMVTVSSRGRKIMINSICIALFIQKKAAQTALWQRKALKEFIKEH